MPLVDGKWRRGMKQVTLAFCWPEAQGRKGVCVCPEGVHHSPGFLTTWKNSLAFWRVWRYWAGSFISSPKACFHFIFF